MNIEYLGSAPAEEPCAQTTEEDFAEKNRRECKVYLQMLSRLFPVPDGVDARLRVTSASHEFGDYREVVVKFGGRRQDAEYAERVQVEAPVRWDERAILELLWFETQAENARKVRSGALAADQVALLLQGREPPESLTMADLVAARPLPDSTRSPLRAIATPLGPLRAALAQYDIGARWAIDLYCARTGAPTTRLTCNLPEVPLTDRLLVCVKTWSENEPLRDALLASGFLEDTGARVRTGYALAEIWRLSGVLAQLAGARFVAAEAA